MNGTPHGIGDVEAPYRRGTGAGLEPYRRRAGATHAPYRRGTAGDIIETPYRRRAGAAPASGLARMPQLIAVNKKVIIVEPVSRESLQK